MDCRQLARVDRGAAMSAGVLIRLAAALAVAVVLWSAWQYIDGRGYDRARAECTAAIDDQKSKAAALLASETAKVRSVEQALQTHLNTQNLKDAENVQVNADKSDRLRAAAGPAGRLRDPAATGCGGSSAGAPGAATAGAGDRAADNPENAGLLSADFTGLLQRLTREADDINAAYQSCRADAFAVRRAPEPEYRLPGM